MVLIVVHEMVLIGVHDLNRFMLISKLILSNIVSSSVQVTREYLKSFIFSKLIDLPS